jgi:glucan 1,4-alpha-glucosidase
MDTGLASCPGPIVIALSNGEQMSRSRAMSAYATTALAALLAAGFAGTGAAAPAAGAPAAPAVAPAVAPATPAALPSPSPVTEAARHNGRPATPAPGAPGADATWTTGAKQGVGTSTSTDSKVWYTLSEGTLAEVYYPRVDVANSRSLELIVTDGETFADRESTDTEHAIELVDARALVYRQVNTDTDGRYEISKTYFTDPDRSTVLIDVTLRSLDGGRYTAYVQYDPSLANSGMHDSGRTQRGALVAEDSSGTEPVASALVADRTFSAATSGFAGVSDGWSDIAEDFDLDDSYGVAENGNVVQTARLKLHGSHRLLSGTIALGFGASTDEAVDAARGSLRGGVDRERASYVRGWHRYLDGLDRLPQSVRRDRALSTQYTVAAMTLKAHEDKTYRGANIASLTVPWGEAQNANEAGVGGYHLVWARDLYQVATAQLAIGDADAANRSLDYLFDVQQRPDGSFPQNTLLDGTPYWTGLQLDEVAFPIVLAWQLGRTDAGTWNDHVKKSADFLVARGPSTPQERWEEEGGYSPSTIAAEIAGLVAASDIAGINGDDGAAAIYAGVADDWQRRVESWTFTTTGPLGDGSYFERIDDDGDPDDGATLSINNGGGDFDERTIVDGGFLELVRLGVKAPDDAAVAGSLQELDSTIRVETPNGPMWYRYNHDGYGEKADGSPYDGTGVGRLWPLLTGERGEYELANGRSATTHLRTMAKAANEGYLIPEQVWDSPDAPDRGLSFGEGTGSATPLAWSMAQFVRLAVSIDEGAPIERPAVVADRYANGALPAGPALEVAVPEEGTTTGESTVTVSGTTNAPTVWVNANGTTVRADVADGAFSASVPLALGPNAVTVVAVGADGGTSLVRRSVTSVNFGTRIGGVSDPVGDDNGPGSYVYPTNGAFSDGAFDLTALDVYEAGDSTNFVVTVDGVIGNPWGGNQLSVQRVDLYVTTADGGDPVDARLGTNARLDGPYDFVVSGSGFATPAVRNAAGTVVADAALLVLPETGQIALTVPTAALGSVDLASAGYQVAMMSHADENEGQGGIRPVYSREFWDASSGTSMSWITEYRFGGGAGEYTDANPARDTDSSDPNVLDILVPPSAQQSVVLDWRGGAPVILPYVQLGTAE